ncbi:putative Alpha-ribazole phosphatase [Balamuthia mandrillaris]
MEENKEDQSKELNADELKAEYEKLKVEVEAFESLHPLSAEQQQSKIQARLEQLGVAKEGALGKDALEELGRQFKVGLTAEESNAFMQRFVRTTDEKADLQEFSKWCAGELPEWSGDKLDYLRMKLRSKALPLDEVKGAKKVSPKTHSHWTKLRGALRVAKFYRTIWKPAPPTEEGWQEVKKVAEEQGKLVKRITFVRHGQSTSNAAWDAHDTEPFIFDAPLTEKGRQQARERAVKLLEEKPVQLVVASPLTRASQTCELVFGHLKGTVPFIVHPLCREQMSGADDVGRLKADLQKDFSEFDLRLVPEGFWWYIPAERHVEGETLEEHYRRYKEAGGWTEPGKVLAKRIQEFEAWIVERPESEFGVVSHGDFIERMCNIDRIGNAEQFILEVDPLNPIVPSEED